MYYQGHHHERSESGDEQDKRDAIAALFLLTFFGIGTWFVFASHLRTALRTRTPAESIHRELVRLLAERQRLVADVAVALSSTGLFALTLIGDASWLCAPMLASSTVLLVAIAQSQSAHKLLAALGYPEVTTSYDGQGYVLVRHGEARLAGLFVSKAQLERVTKAAVPTAKVR